MNKYEKEAAFTLFIIIIASITIAFLTLKLEKAEEQLPSSCLSKDHYDVTKK
jgi:hypothetical protein